jgi:succinate-semialdehyde dehydrogenase/glutarate-semialdehyde dehydrogenase
MHEEADALARLIVHENGKTLADAHAEVRYGAEFLRWYSEEAVRIRGSMQTAPDGSNRMLVIHQPVGMALLITPWNFPLAMATRKVAPALAAGCTVVLKPAEETPLTALYFANILHRVGVPPGVVNVLTCSDPGPVVDTILRHPHLRKLSFTGSTEVGKHLLGRAAERVLNCSMELGGNAPFLVFEDADLDAAVAGALTAKLRNAGQACTASNRFLVHRAVVQEFAERLAAAFRALRLGPGMSPDVDLGPVITEESRDRLARLVSEATDAGAVRLSGGERPNRAGYFYPPTVLSNVPLGHEITCQEIFGPIAPIQAFDSTEEALAAANATPAGLAAYIYTADLRRALEVTELLEVGMVGVNRGLVSEPAAPFGGMKQSGIGREGGQEGLLEFSETKYAAIAW